MNNFMFNGWAHFIATEAEIQFAMTGLSNNGATIPNGKIRSRPLSFFWGHQFLKLPLPRIRCTQSDTSTMTCTQHVGVKSAIKSTLHAHIRIRRRRLWVSRKFHRASRSLRFKGGCCHPGNEERKKKILHSIKRMLVISLPGDITLLKSVEKAVASVFCSTWEQRRQARAASGIEERRG